MDKVSIAEFESQWMGRRVDVPVRLVRRSDHTGDWQSIAKCWEERAIPVSGWVVGVRWVQNGRTQYIDREVGWAWYSHGVVPAALVATSARTTPILVPLRMVTRG